MKIAFLLKNLSQSKRQKLNEIAFQNQDPSEITDIVEKTEQLILLRNKLAA